MAKRKLSYNQALQAMLYGEKNANDLKNFNSKL